MPKIIVRLPGLGSEQQNRENSIAYIRKTVFTAFENFEIISEALKKGENCYINRMINIWLLDRYAAY